MKFFGGSSSATKPEPHPVRNATRRSSSLGELSRQWEGDTPLCVLDLGSTSPNNIRFFTEHGHRIYSEDLLTASTEPHLATQDEEGKPILDSRRFLADNLVYPASHFDVVLCWNLPDYLDESLVRPVMGRLWSVLKPGGMLLAFFHTKDAGPDSPCFRFHITGKDTLDMTPIKKRRDAGDGFHLQRVFNNRNIETLFRDFASIKFFLARDNVREVLVVR